MGKASSWNEVQAQYPFLLLHEDCLPKESMERGPCSALRQSHSQAIETTLNDSGF